MVTVYGAAWDPDSRRVKRFLGEGRIDVRWVDVDHDPDAAAFIRRQSDGNLVMPVVVTEDGTILVSPGPGELSSALGVDAPSSRRFFDLVIVGGGPAGLSAGLQAIREGISCLLVEGGTPGGQAAMTPRLMGAPGFADGTGGAQVRDSLVGQAQRYGLRTLRGVALEELRQIDGYVVAVTSDDEEYTARTALIATGAAWGSLGVPGEETFRGNGVHFCASCDGPFYRKAEELLVVGAGDLGAQEALFLTQFAAKVRVLEYGPEIKASPLLQEKLRRHPKIEFYTSTELVELLAGPDGKLAEAVVKDRTTGYVFSFNPAALFIYAGLRPNTGPLKGTIDLDPAGFVVTDRGLETSIPGVFAAGDVRAGSTKQLGAAMAEGAAAVLMIRQHLEALGDLAPRAST